MLALPENEYSMKGRRARVCSCLCVHKLKHTFSQKLPKNCNIFTILTLKCRFALDMMSIRKKNIFLNIDIYITVLISLFIISSLEAMLLIYFWSSLDRMAKCEVTFSSKWSLIWTRYRGEWSHQKDCVQICISSSYTQLHQHPPLSHPQQPAMRVSVSQSVSTPVQIGWKSAFCPYYFITVIGLISQITGIRQVCCGRVPRIEGTPATVFVQLGP